MPPKSAAAKGGAAAGGDGKRYFKTPAQVSSLEAAFGADPEPGVEARHALAADIKLSYDQVTVSGGDVRARAGGGRERESDDG